MPVHKKTAKCPYCGGTKGTKGAMVGKADYDADVSERPTYHDGAPRKTWEQLGAVEQWSWNRRVSETVVSFGEIRVEPW